MHSHPPPCSYGICLAGFSLNNVELCIVYACDQGSYYCILFSGIISVFISCIASVLIFSVTIVELTSRAATTTNIIKRGQQYNYACVNLYIVLHNNVCMYKSVCYIIPPPGLVSSQVMEVQSHIYKGLIFGVEGEMNWL